MPRQSTTYRKIWTFAGVAAAIAMAVRGVLDWRSGSGAPLIIVAVAIVAAIVLRRTRFRD